jgi:hypothetical protein
MSPEAQRIAIAELDGWTEIRPQEKWKHGGVLSEGTLAGKSKGRTQVPLRDYLNDLNAMREAKKMIRPDQWETYAGHLAVFNQPLSSFKFLNATADEEAEALLKTFNLWEESE